jgi:acetyltransferase-like isoleucine patch superfamily enzyme
MTKSSFLNKVWLFLSGIVVSSVIKKMLLGKTRKVRNSAELYKGLLQSLGKNTKLPKDIHIIDPQSTIIGDNVLLGKNLFLNAAGGVIIGHGTKIADNCTIYAYKHHNGPKTLFYNSESLPEPVIIGQNVNIEENTLILSGVTIGDNATIASNSVISEDVLPNITIGDTNVSRKIRSSISPVPVIGKQRQDSKRFFL